MSMYPEGRSLARALVAADSSSVDDKAALVAGTAGAMACLCAVALWPPLACAPPPTWAGAVQRGERLLGAPEGTSRWAAGLSAVAYSVLFALSAAGVRWPAGWRCLPSTATYRRMFSEPTGSGLVGAWGNTVSNLPFLWGGLVVLSGGGGAFEAADAMFGGLLLVLSVLSTGWHATLYRRVQYLDLAAMNLCISYLILRHAAMAARSLGAPCSASALAAVFGGAVAAAFAVAVRMAARGGPYESGFPAAGRVRLAAGDLTVADACMFWAMPVIYFALPLSSMLFLLGSGGDGTMLALTSGTLAVGWTYRMLERFLLDSVPPMRWCGAGAAGRVGAAILSPTAWLHWLCGVTLVAGLAHARSLDARLPGGAL